MSEYSHRINVLVYVQVYIQVKTAINTYPVGKREKNTIYFKSYKAIKIKRDGKLNIYIKRTGIGNIIG